MDIAKFRSLPILGILRGIRAEEIEPIVETAVESGLETIEITMDTDAAVSLIRRAKDISAGRLAVGAGTVTSEELLMSAVGAGAGFIVMPVLVKDVVAYCVKNKIPVFPGALTPQEIFEAHLAGATMVKVFPSGLVGPGYFRDIKGPFSGIELLACGGVTPENMKSYLSGGASAVAFGGSVFRKDWLGKKDFKSVGRVIKEYVSVFKK